MSVSHLRGIFMDSVGSSALSFSLQLYCPVYKDSFFGRKFTFLVCEKIKREISTTVDLNLTNDPSWQEFCNLDAAYIYPIASAYGFYSPSFAIMVYMNIKAPTPTRADTDTINLKNINWLDTCQQEMINYEQDYWKLLETEHKRIAI
jgi:hypothetical protein